jgi:hypothetical protein
MDRSRSYLLITQKVLQKIYTLFSALSCTQDSFIINGMSTPNVVGSGFIMKPWGQFHERSKISCFIECRIIKITGLQMQLLRRPLPGGGLFPISFFITLCSYVSNGHGW